MKRPENWKHARWEKLREMVAKEIEARPRPDDNKDLDGYAQYTLDMTTAAVQMYVPISRRCKYAKRWWTEDLTKLKNDYTIHSGETRHERRGGTVSETVGLRRKPRCSRNGSMTQHTNRGICGRRR